MIARRALLLGGLAQASLWTIGSAGAGLPPNDRVNFRIARKGEAIGRHTVSFARDGADLSVSVVVEIDVRFGPIPLYRYRHAATERWRDNTFVSLDARTDDNGEDFRVSVSRISDGYRVTGAKGTYVASPEAHAATHWNRHQLDGPLINTQTGELMRPDVADRGAETIVGPDGNAITARHYSLSGDAVFDLWYDSEDRWVGLAFNGKDGADIRYLVG